MDHFSAKALIVDDEEMVCTLTSRALKQVGFSIDCAQGGKKGQELLRQNQYDLLVTDLGMPEINGHTLCLEALQMKPKPVITLLTGIIEPKIANDLQSRGVDQIFFKPVDYSILAERLKSLVTRRQAEKPKTLPTEIDLAPNDDSEALQSLTEHEANNRPIAKNGKRRVKCAVLLLKDTRRGMTYKNAMESSENSVILLSSSEDLYQHLDSGQIDLLIIEEELRGFLKGTEILKRLHDHFFYPEVILLADSPPQLESISDSLGIKKVFKNSVNPQTVADYALGILNSLEIPNELIPIGAQRLVQQVESFPMVPQVLVKLNSYLDLPLEEIPIREFADTLALDTGATVSLLKIANSSSSGVRNEVTSVFEAVNLLGITQAIKLILETCTIGSQSNMMSEWSKELRNWYQHRCVFTATTASVFAERLENISSERAYLLGLFQDLGIVIFVNRIKDRYLRILHRYFNAGAVKLHALEQEVFQFTHADVSGALLAQWGFPQSMVDQVLRHHTTKQVDGLSKSENSLLRVMQIGESLSSLTDLEHPIRRRTFEILVRSYKNVDDKTIEKYILESKIKKTEACKLFLMPEPDTAILQNVFKRNLETLDLGVGASSR